MSTQDQIAANLLALNFNNPSNVALYNKIAQAIGIPIDNTLTEIQNSETRITQIINLQRYGKSDYYTSKALAFQYGDDLIVDPATLDNVYAAIDPTKQIIKQAAFEVQVSGQSTQLFLKVATIDTVTGNLIALSTPQMAAFTNYFINFEIPGLPISKVSLAGNVLNFLSTATYYATYDLPTLQANLSAALTAFRETFTFNGEFFAGDLSDYVKSNVPGIRDFYIYNSSVDSVPFGGSQNLTAGYFNYDSNILNNISYVGV